MASTITLGHTPVSTATYLNIANTTICHNNPSAYDGSLDTFSLYVNTSSTSVKMGTFSSDGGGYWTSVDSVVLGTVAPGALRTFTGNDVAVGTNDVLAITAGSGAQLFYTAATATGIGVEAGDKFTGLSVLFDPVFADIKPSMQATGFSYPGPKTKPILMNYYNQRRS